MDIGLVRDTKTTDSNRVNDPVPWEHFYGYTDINNEAKQPVNSKKAAIKWT